MGKKSLILGFAGMVLGLITDWITTKQTEIAVETQVNEILKEKGLVTEEEDG